MTDEPKPLPTMGDALLEIQQRLSQFPSRGQYGDNGVFGWFLGLESDNKELRERLKARVDLESEAAHEVYELRQERLRFYLPNGTFEVLDSPDEVVKLRKEAAERLEFLELVKERAEALAAIGPNHQFFAFHHERLREVLDPEYGQQDEPDNCGH